jgi:hypothetical protein
VSIGGCRHLGRRAGRDASPNRHRDIFTMLFPMPYTFQGCSNGLGLPRRIDRPIRPPVLSRAPPHWYDQRRQDHSPTGSTILASTEQSMPVLPCDPRAQLELGLLVELEATQNRSRFCERPSLIGWSD